jgi:hypothetical protein
MIEGGITTALGFHARKGDDRTNRRSRGRDVAITDEVYSPSMAIHCIPTRFGLLILAAIACNGTDAKGPAPVVERETLGDTVVVRTLSGSKWGDSVRLVEELRIGKSDGSAEYTFGPMIGPIAVGLGGTIYVSDIQQNALRAYDSLGQYLRTIGRPGKGPGEFGRIVGLALLPNGNLVARDQFGGRLLVYSESGASLATWDANATFSPWPFRRFTLRTDSSGFIYEYAMLYPPRGASDEEPSTYGFVRLDSTGRLVDSLMPPRWPVIISQTAYHPRAHVVMHPHGYMVAGISTRYAVDLLRNAHSVLRIERRDRSPIPVPAAEKAAFIAQSMAEYGKPDVNGALPDVKAAFRDLAVGDDGRIWVHLFVPSVERTSPEDSTVPIGARPPRWHEPNEAWDVFESDGTYLGRVQSPPGAELVTMRGDRVWGTAVNQNGETYVVRWRIEHM